MALATYADLQSAVQNWLGHSLFTDRVPEFITLFEATACRRLGVRETQTTTNLTPSSGSATLPTDFLYAKRVTWTGSPRVDLEYVHPSYLQAANPASDSGTPNKYTIEGSALRVAPISDTVLELLYAARTAAVATTLNWLFTKHPDAYLFGALCEAEGFGVNDERSGLWRSRMEAAFNEIRTADFNGRGPMTIRVMQATP